MSIFGSIGKFLGKVVHVAAPVLGAASGLIPGVGGVVAHLLTSKLGSKAVTLVKAGKAVGKAFPGQVTYATAAAPGALVAMKHSRHAHKLAGLKKVVSSRTSRKRRTTKPKAVKRRARKLKFGSPAWRKKYMKRAA